MADPRYLAASQMGLRKADELIDAIKGLTVAIIGASEEDEDLMHAIEAKARELIRADLSHAPPEQRLTLGLELANLVKDASGAARD